MIYTKNIIITCITYFPTVTFCAYFWFRIYKSDNLDYRTLVNSNFPHHLYTTAITASVSAVDPKQNDGGTIFKNADKAHKFNWNLANCILELHAPSRIYQWPLKNWYLQGAPHHPIYNRVCEFTAPKNC